MWGMLGASWELVSIFEEDRHNVPVHGEVACSVAVVPSNVYAHKSGSGPVGSDGVVMLEGSKQVIGITAFAVLNAKVIKMRTNMIECQRWCQSPGMVAH